MTTTTIPAPGVSDALAWDDAPIPYWLTVEGDRALGAHVSTLCLDCGVIRSAALDAVHPCALAEAGR